MSGLAARIVRIAASLLPANQRDRYREQWLGELRDAPTVGIRSLDIAVGSLAFAATFARPMPVGARLSAEMVSRRARLAIALSTSAAILAVAQYASPAISAPTSTDLAGSAIATLALMLTLYSVLAPLTGIVIAFATLGMRRRTRLAVLLISAACLAPIGLNAITYAVLNSQYGFYFSIAEAFIPGALSLGALCALAVWRKRHPLGAAVRLPRTSRRMLHSTLAGAGVALATAGAFVEASILWDSRTPLVFRDAVTASNRADFDQWLALRASGEQMVAVTLDVWFAVGLAIACAVVLAGLSRRATALSTVTFAVAAVSVVALSFGTVVSFLQEMLPTITPNSPADLVSLLAQVGLVFAIFAATAGTRRADAGLGAASIEANDVVAASHG